MVSKKQALPNIETILVFLGKHHLHLLKLLPGRIQKVLSDIQKALVDIELALSLENILCSAVSFPTPIGKRSSGEDSMSAFLP